MEKDTLAMEMLHELKRSSRRNFIIAVILLIALVISNLSWLIYESQFEEVSEQEQLIQDITDTTNTTFNQEIK